MKLKYSISIFLILWTCSTTYSQDLRTGILQQDLSCLFDSLSMMGILGDDCSRIDIRFCEAQKTGDKDYKIKGVSRTRLSVICPFEGKVCIDSISSGPQIKEECTEIDGFIYGHYLFTVRGDKRCSGVFSGSFKQSYRINKKQICKGRNEIVELKLNLSEYVGTWKSANGITKICSWADAVIANTPPNFCRFADSGEWIVSPQYRRNGWDNYYNAYYRAHDRAHNSTYFNDKLTTDEIIQKARRLEEQKWWVDKSQSYKTK